MNYYLCTCPLIDGEMYIIVEFWLLSSWTGDDMHIPAWLHDPQICVCGKLNLYVTPTQEASRIILETKPKVDTFRYFRAESHVPEALDLEKVVIGPICIKSNVVS